MQIPVPKRNLCVFIAATACYFLVLNSSWYAKGQKVEGTQTQTPVARIDPGLAYRMHKGSNRRVLLPRLTQFPDAEAMRTANGDLGRQQSNLSARASGCLAGNKKHSFWEQRTRVAVLTRDVLSIDSKASVYCGGPHPDVEYFPLTYSMRTGKQFDFNRDAALIFIAGRLPSAELMKLYVRQYSTELRDCKPSAIFDSFGNGSNFGIFLHFERDGLAITPDLPHVIAGCGPQEVVPYQELSPLLKEDNPFRSLTNK